MKLPEIDDAQVYGPNKLPLKKLDYLIYMNYISRVNLQYARKNIMYISNAYPGFNNLDGIYDFLKTQEIDAFFSYSHEVVEYLRNKGKKAMFLNFAVDSDEYYKREFNKDFSFDVAFVGNNVKEPSRTIKYLYPANKLKGFALFGTWKKTNVVPTFQILQSVKNIGVYAFLMLLKKIKNYRSSDKYIARLSDLSRGKISQEDMLNVLSSSKILLNYTFDVAAKWGVLNYRILEIMACGGFVLTDRIPQLEKELDGCVAFHNGGRDLTKKINYYLEHQDEREKIAKKGHEYFLKNGTTTIRAKEILNYLKEV
jgi:spore maturation protein CgeB